MLFGPHGLSEAEIALKAEIALLVKVRAEVQSKMIHLKIDLDAERAPALRAGPGPSRPAFRGRFVAEQPTQEKAMVLESSYERLSGLFDMMTMMLKAKRKSLRKARVRRMYDAWMRQHEDDLVKRRLKRAREMRSVQEYAMLKAMTTAFAAPMLRVV
jgi:hypothetical protein